MIQARTLDAVSPPNGTERGSKTRHSTEHVSIILSRWRKPDTNLEFWLSLVETSSNFYTVSQKMRNHTLVHIFTTYWWNLKMLLLAHFL